MRKTIAQDVYERAQPMIAQGMSISEAIRKIAQDDGRSYGSLAVSYYRWKRRLEGRDQNGSAVQSGARTGVGRRSSGQVRTGKHERVIEDLRAIIRQRSTELRALKAALHDAQSKSAA
jgi:hypothetical protein